MAEASIPVDLFNPGQVFACLGFLEAADVLLGEAEGGFDWSDEANVRFVLRAEGEENPFAHVLGFLAEAEVTRFGPLGYKDPPAKKKGKDADEDGDTDDPDVDEAPETETGPEPSHSGASSVELSDAFPAKIGDRMALPIRLGGGNRPRIELTHWADDNTGRQSFKLYAGNRSADRIARAMLTGARKKSTKRKAEAGVPGDLTSKGIRQLWETQQASLIETPFDILTPMGGSFNFDPRGAWTAIDAGYSPNDQKHKIEASPVVEFLAAWGLQHARPEKPQSRRVRYAVWSSMLPPFLSRVALIGAVPALPKRRLIFELANSGKNSVITFAREEITYDHVDH